MGPSTYKMKKPAQFYVLYILSWALLALTACSFLGLLDLTTNAAEMEAQALQAFLGELLPLAFTPGTMGRKEEKEEPPCGCTT